MPDNRDRPPREKRDDVVWVHSQSSDGESLNVLRKRGEELSLGQLRKAEEGRPIAGELLALEPHESGAPRLFDVRVLHEGGARTEGPSHVSTVAYREGWAEIFGRKRRRAAKLN